MIAEIKEVAGFGESFENSYGTTNYPIFLKIEAGGNVGKVRVCAQKKDRWKVGQKVNVNPTDQKWQGPDGIEDWTYVRLDNLKDDGTAFERKGNRSRTQHAAPTPTDEAITFDAASQAYDTILDACGADQGKANALFQQYMKGRKIEALPTFDYSEKTTEEPKLDTGSDFFQGM